MTNLSTNLAIHLELKARLLAQFPVLAEDEEALADTIEGISDLQDKLAAIFESSRMDDLMAEACATRIKELAERRGRLEDCSSTKRSLIAWAMQEAAIKKIERGPVTLSLRNVPPSVQIIDETLLPDRCVKVKTVRSPDKAEIKALLDAGKEVPGASLGNGSTSLSVRVK